MTVSFGAARPDRASFLLIADGLAVAVAVALPWSTSATGICIVLWLAALFPTLDLPTIRREVFTAAGGLPVLLWGLSAIGMLWADAGWAERFAGFSSFHRLLVIPLLLAQFRRSGHGAWVAGAFLISSALVLLLSFVLILTPGLTWRGNYDGVPVHDYLYQGSAFLICGFGAIGAACHETVRRRRKFAIGLCLLGALFIANFAFATIGRVALLVAPVLVALLGWRLARWKGLLCACAVGAAVGAALWFASLTLRARVDSAIAQTRDYGSTNDATSIGQHIAFLRESAKIIQAAPIFGHGTGSIHEQFGLVTAGATGAAAVATVNPHNQTFAVAIQIGLVGAAVLWTMWIAHFLLFRGEGIPAWLGTVVVAENIVSSTVHTHLFDFSNGWLYAFGVGVLGGSVLRERAQAAAQSSKIAAAASRRE
ncbi:MAG: O-antigen ligase family protein [Xanthobacteraceae bacterium]